MMLLNRGETHAWWFDRDVSLHKLPLCNPTQYGANGTNNYGSLHAQSNTNLGSTHTSTDAALGTFPA